MNRPVTAVFAALEALLVVGIGVGVPVVLLSLLWAFQYGLQLDWLIFWRAAVDVWLVGHGADLTLQLSADAAAATGVAGADAPIRVTIAALGFSVLTVLLAVRAGRAVAETPHRVLGTLVSIAAFAVLALGLTASAQHELAAPSLWQGTLLPTLVYAVPLVTMAEVTRRRRGGPADPATDLVLNLVARIPRVGRAVVGSALRIGVGSLAVVLAVASVVVALLLLTSYAELITLYEGAHAGLLGGLALTIGQLALLPDLVVWAVSWFVGPGFALGTGSQVSPLGTNVGPLPAVPFLGALPTGDPAFAFLGLLVPVVAGFVVATVLRPRVERVLAESGVDDLLRRALVGLAGGVVAGVAVGLLAWAASGSAGPGRLAQVGPDPLAVGGFAALEVGVPAALALIVSVRRLLGHDDEASSSDESRGGADRVTEAAPAPSSAARQQAGGGDADATGPIAVAAPPERSSWRSVLERVPFGAGRSAATGEGATGDGATAGEAPTAPASIRPADAAPSVAAQEDAPSVGEPGRPSWMPAPRERTPEPASPWWVRPGGTSSADESADAPNRDTGRDRGGRGDDCDDVTEPIDDVRR